MSHCMNIAIQLKTNDFQLLHPEISVERLPRFARFGTKLPTVSRSRRIQRAETDKPALKTDGRWGTFFDAWNFRRKAKPARTVGP